LPHSRTLSKWYRNVNAEPGFTEESLKMVTLKVNNSPHPILLALSMDEMAIIQHLEFDGIMEGLIWEIIWTMFSFYGSFGK